MPFPGCPLSIAAKSHPPAAAEGETGAHQIGGAERAEGGIAPAVVHADVLIALAALLDPMKGRLILRIARLHLNRLLQHLKGQDLVSHTGVGNAGEIVPAGIALFGRDALQNGKGVVIGSGLNEMERGLKVGGVLLG